MVEKGKLHAEANDSPDTNMYHVKTDEEENPTMFTHKYRKSISNASTNEKRTLDGIEKPHHGTKSQEDSMINKFSDKSSISDKPPRFEPDFSSDHSNIVGVNLY